MSEADSSEVVQEGDGDEPKPTYIRRLGKVYHFSDAADRNRGMAMLLRFKTGRISAEDLEAQYPGLLAFDKQAQRDQAREHAGVLDAYNYVMETERNPSEWVYVDTRRETAELLVPLIHQHRGSVPPGVPVALPTFTDDELAPRSAAGKKPLIEDLKRLGCTDDDIIPIMIANVRGKNLPADGFLVHIDRVWILRMVEMEYHIIE
jgi:hypothetical protein